MEKVVFFLKSSYFIFIYILTYALVILRAHSILASSFPRRRGFGALHTCALDPRLRGDDGTREDDRPCGMTALRG
ncbi:hypothetical protein AYO29_00995 [Coxiella burnetii str. Schperling]|nr:hypothetical protein AYO29_00995 [Coxiella burnetii str. Schperling]